MNTVMCKMPEGKTRYYLADESGNPVPEVMDYLKFLDNQGKARNTLRLSCYQLQNYYQFLLILSSVFSRFFNGFSAPE